MKAGCRVKIPDIGPLATVAQTGRNMVKIELEGDQFWMPVELLENVEKGSVKMTRNEQDVYECWDEETEEFDWEEYQELCDFADYWDCEE